MLKSLCNWLKHRANTPHSSHRSIDSLGTMETVTFPSLAKCQDMLTALAKKVEAEGSERGSAVPHSDFLVSRS